MDAHKEHFPEEEFVQFESKVNEVMKILQDMSSKDPESQAEGIKTADKFLGESSQTEDINEDNFIVKVRENRTIINKSGQKQDDPPVQLDKFTFMQQVEQDAAKRAQVKRERENIAQYFRQRGNEAFHQREYENAVNMFTKAIEHVKDSPILYNNRALAYIKLQVNRRAINDCDFVINKLDEKNLRAWLYRAAAYYKMGDEKNFETSIKWAKKNNSKEMGTIDGFVKKVKTEDF